MNLPDVIEGRVAALTVSEVAAILSVSERQVYKLAATNRIPSFKIGASIRFDPADFAEWLRNKMAVQPVRQPIRGANPSEVFQRRAS
jgi:excisionase family DNA binding protein